jgi:hypothetical protein
MQRFPGWHSVILSAACCSSRIARWRNHAFTVGWALLAASRVYREAGRFTEALSTGEEAIELCERHGFVARLGTVLLQTGGTHCRLGETERSLTETRRGLELWRRTECTPRRLRSGQALSARDGRSAGAARPPALGHGTLLTGARLELMVDDKDRYRSGAFASARSGSASRCAVHPGTNGYPAPLFAGMISVPIAARAAQVIA